MSFVRVGRRGVAAAMLLAAAMAEEGIADAPKPIQASITKPEAAKPEDFTAADRVSSPGAPERVLPGIGADKAAFDTFLDRLMRAESGGRDTAANPRSTAIGPFQFIKSTFLDLARRHFSLEVQELSDDQLLEMRTDRAFARRCAEIYSKENLSFLAEQGLQPTFGHLRLAFLLGPYGAAKILQAHPATPVAQILGPAVVRANPFMARMSASNLAAKAARDVGESAVEVDAAAEPYVRAAAVQPDPVASPRPSAKVAARPSCNTKLASCRKFTVMQSRKAKVAQSRASRPSQSGRKAAAETKRRGAGA